MSYCLAGVFGFGVFAMRVICGLWCRLLWSCCSCKIRILKSVEILRFACFGFGVFRLLVSCCFEVFLVICAFFALV